MRNKRYLLLAMLAVVALALSASLVGAQDAKVIKIASQSPLSGDQSVLGSSIANAVALAVEQLGGPLADMGYKLEHVPFDDQASPDVGVANANNLVNDPAILAVVGHLNSGVAIPSSEVYNANDLVMVSPANTNPRITSRGFPVVNRVCGRDDLQGPTGARFLSSKGAKSVYIVHDTTAYGQGVAEFFKAESENLGMTVLGFEGTQEKSNFEGIIQPILALAPDAIYFGGLYPQAGPLINQARSAGYTGLFMGPDGFDSSDFAKLAGEAGVGTYYSSVAGPTNIYPNAAKFITDYTAKFGEGPQPFAAQAYDATAVVINGIRIAAELAGDVPSRASVTSAVRGTKGYAGLTGTITFDAYGDNEIGLYYVLEVKSSDPLQWGSNTLLESLQIPSPYKALVDKMMGM